MQKYRGIYLTLMFKSLMIDYNKCPPKKLSIDYIGCTLSNRKYFLYHYVESENLKGYGNCRQFMIYFSACIFSETFFSVIRFIVFKTL